MGEVRGDPDRRQHPAVRLQSAVLHLVKPPLPRPSDLSLLGSAVAASSAGWSALEAWRQRDATLASGALLTLLVAALLLRRDPPRQRGSRQDALLSLPALVGPAFLGAATRLGAPLFSLVPVGVALVVGGCLFAGASLLALGRSFGVFPARRALVTHGPYAWVRHPVYLGELIALLGLCLQRATPAALGWTALIIGAVALRVRLEERVLAADPAHAAYRKRVRFRLLPHIW